MSVSVINPTIASLLAPARQTQSQNESQSAARDPAAYVTSSAIASDGALTGSTTATLSSDTQTILLSLQEDLPTIALKSIRQMLFDRYDSDKSGVIDESEWQNYRDTTIKALGEEAAMNIRDFNINDETQPVGAQMIMHVSLDGIVKHVDDTPV